MNYFEHNDSKGRDARRAVELNRAERRKAVDFDGTLFMTRADIRSRRIEALFTRPALTGAIFRAAY